MDERKYNPDPWDTGVYGTGPTEPPKNRGGVVALLLILIIFLCGIITVLGILNVKMFQELNTPKTEELSIAYVDEALLSVLPQETQAPETLPAQVPQQEREMASVALEDSPLSQENIPQEGGLSLQEIYVKNSPSVVSITSHSRRGTGTGTGVILTKDGYIVTNAHVVEEAGTISARLSDDRILEASLVGMDQITDLAVLRIQAENLAPATLGDSTKLRVGDAVCAIGDPLGSEFRGTYTDGIVSAINRDVAIDGRTMTLIQTNAALNSGNSGGPLINCYGQVIGINTMKIGVNADDSGVEGIGFAIPSTTVEDIVNQIIAQGYVSGRPTLGIQGDGLDIFYQRYYGFPPGLYITHVDPGGTAGRAGVEEGDILVNAGGEQITDMESLNTVLYDYEAGDSISITIYRGGKVATVELTLDEAKN